MTRSHALHQFALASAEFRLIVACCTPPDGEVRPQRTKHALEQSVDWEHVLSLARRHRVSALVASALAAEQRVPLAIRNSLKEATRETLLMNMRALQSQMRLQKLFEENGLRFAVLKGIPLAAKAYGSLALRQSRDIDLLVDETEVGRVDHLLESAGYRRAGLEAKLLPHQLALWMRTRKHFEYVNPSGGVSLEVHWRTADNRYLMRMTDPLSRREMVEVAPGVSLPTLSQEDLLLDLCVHGAGHAWFRLKWLADVAALLHKAGPYAQQKLLTDARHRGLERPVLQAMHLCHTLFAVPAVAPTKAVPVPLRILLRTAAAALLQEDVTPPTSTADFVPRFRTTGGRSR